MIPHRNTSLPTPAAIPPWVGLWSVAMADNGEVFYATENDEVLAPVVKQITREAVHRLTEAAGEEVGVFILAGRVGTTSCDVGMSVPEMFDVVARFVANVTRRFAAKLH